MPNSHAWREIRAAFNRFPKRELFYADAADLKEIIDRIVYMTGDDEVAVHCRKGAGYEALYVAFSRLRYSYQIEEALQERARPTSSGPWPSRTSVDCGAVTLLLFYFDAARLERPLDAETRQAPDAGPLVTTWEDRVAVALDREFGEARGAAAVRPLRPPGDPQRPVPRVHAARGGARRHPAPREPGGPARGADRARGARRRRP